MPDVVIVRNLSETDFHGKYDSRPFNIPAGGEALLDKEAACIWFGNWEARNVGTMSQNQFRTDEHNRIRALYGAHFDDRPTDEGWVLDKALKADQKWKANMPNVEIFVQDERGRPVRVVSVIEDPQGKALPIESTPVVDMAKVVASQQTQIDAMQEALDALRSQTMTAPVDSPGRAPQRGRKPITAEAVREEADA